MKFDEIKSSQILDEVRMGQSDLDNFVNSPQAQGIKIGFEAELCFRGLGEGSGFTDYDAEPEYERTNEYLYSISDVFDFFYDGDHNSRRECQRAVDRLTESYHEWVDETLSNEFSEDEDMLVRDWIVENDYDRDDELRTAILSLVDDDEERADKVLAADRDSEDQEEKELYAIYLEAQDNINQELQDRIDLAIRENNHDWQSAYDAYREEKLEDDDFSESQFFRDTCGSRSAWDIYRTWLDSDINWPYLEYPEIADGEFNEHGAAVLVQSLKRMTGMKVRSGEYHSVSRQDDLWIIESDGSLSPDDSSDMPAEIVSPPMPLAQGLEMIDKFWDWATDEVDAYSNDSTGCHVGVSLPYREGRIDYVKLALFLGDHYVLEQFGREANSYCRASLDKIDMDIKRLNKADLTGSLDLMRHGLLELATNHITKYFHHGKYTSINLKNGKYVEFRSMGGSDYINNKQLITNTIKRFCYAMWLASEPAAERKSYYTKLYKLLSKYSRKSDELTGIEIFSKLQTKQMSREEAIQLLRDRAKSRGNEPTAKKQPSQINQQNSQINQQGEWTGYWLIVNDSTGQILHRFGGIGNAQSDANRVGREWLNRNAPDSSVTMDIIVIPERQ